MQCTEGPNGVKKKWFQVVQAVSAAHNLREADRMQPARNAVPEIECGVARHEIVGVVTAVGAEVDNFKVGDLAGVGCMVDSCRKCVLFVISPCSSRRSCAVHVLRCLLRVG